MSAASAHLDTFARDHLPPPGQWPELRWLAGSPEESQLHF